MEMTLLTAGCTVYMSVLCLLRFPGGLANVVKTNGGWLFIFADITALLISMTVLIVGMTVAPTFWKKVEMRANKAMCIALVSFAIAARHVFITVVGNYFWLWVVINGSFIVLMGFICVAIIIILRSD